MVSVRSQRIITFALAILFLLSTLGSIAYYVLAVQQQQSITATADSLKQNTTKAVSTKLQGTKLTNFQPISNVSSLQTEDLTPGSGAVVQAGATVTVNYTGAVAATGVIFQSSLDTGQPVTFPLSQVIPGWSQGIPGMKVGGTRRLIIPANLAYGANPPQGSGIPPNAALVFDVQLIKID